MSVFQIGAKYRARPTALNAKNGVKENSPCWITFVEPTFVSFYAQKSPDAGAGWIEAKAANDAFAANFTAEVFSTPNLGYRRGQPAQKLYQ
jgi:hypothetical protein